MAVTRCPQPSKVPHYLSYRQGTFAAECWITYLCVLDKTVKQKLFLSTSETLAWGHTHHQGMPPRMFGITVFWSKLTLLLALLPPSLSSRGNRAQYWIWIVDHAEVSVDDMWQTFIYNDELFIQKEENGVRTSKGLRSAPTCTPQSMKAFICLQKTCMPIYCFVCLLRELPLAALSCSDDVILTLVILWRWVE